MTADVRQIPASSTVLGLSTNLVIKGGPAVTPSQGPVGIIRKITCLATNTAACFFNDGTGTASGSTTVWSIGSGGMAVGAVTTIDFPVFQGMTFVSGGGTFSLAWD